MMISVCMITYGHEKYIKEAIEGVLMQDCNFEVELLIADDCSPDNTDKIVADIQQNHMNGSWINYTKHTENKGMMPNFVWALENCQGKYIALCEGDDYWTDPLKLQKQVDFLEANEDYALVFTNGKIDYSDSNHEKHLIYSDEKETNTIYSIFDLPKETTDIFKLAKGNYIHTAGVLFRNWIKDEGVPKYMQEVTIGDWPLHIRTATKGLIKFIDEDTFCYRVSNSGIYSKKSRIDKIKMSLGQFAPILNSTYFEDDVRNVITNYCIKCSETYINVCNNESDYNFFKNLIASFNSSNDSLKTKLIQILDNKNKRKQKKNLFQSIYYRLKRKIKNILNK